MARNQINTVAGDECKLRSGEQNRPNSIKRLQNSVTGLASGIKSDNDNEKLYWNAWTHTADDLVTDLVTKTLQAIYTVLYTVCIT